MLTSSTKTLLIFLVILILPAMIGCDSPTPPPQADTVKEESITDSGGVIVAMGDSLTAGLGVAPQESYPAQLEKLLEERGLN